MKKAWLRAQHVPSWEEFEVLRDYLGNTSGGKLKEAGTEHWSSPNTDATNESGFTGLPGGGMDTHPSDPSEPPADFTGIGHHGCYWSSTEGRYMILAYDTGNWGYGWFVISFGWSVRCLRD